MKKRLAVLIALTLAASTAAGCTGRDNGIPTVKVTSGDVMSTVAVSGNLEAPNDRFLSFAMPGTVEIVNVEKGDAVRSGDVLARLEASALQRNVDMAVAGVEQAQVQYEIAEHQLRNTIYPHYYGSYVIDVPGTWMALDSAADRVETARARIEAGDTAGAQLLLDDVMAEIDRAKTSSQSRLWDFPLPVKIMELQRQAAAIAVDVALLNLDAAREALDDATITAPFDGIITAVEIKNGDELTAASLAAPAFHIIDPSLLEMTGLIDEMDIADITTGQKAIITLDALPGLEVEGKVTYISEAATIQAGVVMYETTITLQSPGTAVKDGMSATADIVLEERTNALLLPAAAVMKSDAGRDIVYVIGADGKAEMREITTGLRSGGQVEIVHGVVAGDVVALQAPEK